MSTSITTKARRKALAEITSGKISAISPISHIAFGNGGVDEYGEPKIPSDEQAALFNEIARYPADNVSYPVETTARYTVEIPETALAGAEISEVGLFDSNGVLCAIKTMYVKKKDEGIKFAFEFDDQF